MSQAFGKTEAIFSNTIVPHNSGDAMQSKHIRTVLLNLLKQNELSAYDQQQLLEYEDTWQGRAVHEPSIKMLLAQHPAIGLDTQRALLAENNVVRRFLAKNFSILEEIQLQLVHDQAIALVGNQNLTAKAQMALLQQFPVHLESSNRYLWNILLDHPNVSAQAQHKIMQEMGEEHILRKPNPETEVSAQYGFTVPDFIDRTAYMTTAQQFSLYRSGHRKQLCTLARCSNLMEKLQYKLLEENDALIVSFLADNRFICDDIKTQIFESRSAYI